jgi:hypothetical protein
VHVIGLGLEIASHAGAYEHPLTAVHAGAVSAVLNHPLPASNVLVFLPDAEVYVGAGMVLIVPVWVYVAYGGSALTSVAGGQVPYDASWAAEIVPAPAPPVCHALRGALNGLLATPCAAHVPIASRGSVVIHPSCRPSWYDQNGDSTESETLDLPIFHVQKNQFYRTS